MSTDAAIRSGARIRVPQLAGSFAVIAGLVVIWAVFQVLNQNFLSARNLSNLVLQIAVLGVLAIGMVMVLVIGEIDLSVGAIAGVSAASLAVLVTNLGAPAAVGIVVAIVSGCLIGLLHGTVITAIGIPSFIVTLAGLLVWQGVQLAVVGPGGEIAILDPFIQGIASTYMPPLAGWGLAVVAIVVTAVLRLTRRRRRRQFDLPVAPLGVDLGILAAIAVVTAGITAVLNSYFGIPWVLLLVLVLVVLVSVVLGRTRFGRHMYAIGGNREAARRAGIRVRGVTVLVFVAVSGIAALAGVIEASREFSASSALGGGTLQLNAIAAAVIGGTSLFGGRGKVYQAILGALVVGSVENGLDLLGQPAAVQNIATGLILAVAVSIDAITRRRRVARGGPA